MRSISAVHPQVSSGAASGLGEAMASNSEAATPSSTQKAVSHLSRWAALNLVTVAFFWGERLPCPSEPSFLGVW